MKPVSIIRTIINIFLLGLSIMVLLIPVSAWAEDYSETEGNEYIVNDHIERIDFSGSVDLRSSSSKMREKSPFYQIDFRNESADLSEYLLSSSAALYLNGDFATKEMGAHFKTYSLYQYPGNNTFRFDELYGNINFGSNSSLQAGKIVYKWGKGYAFNPTGYVNPVKNPEDPESAAEGTLSLNFETIKSYENSPFQTVALNLLILPGSNSINDQYWELDDTGLAAKAYFLINGVDIDLMGYYRNDGARYTGIDTSFNITSSLEMHGEFSYGAKVERNFIYNGAPNEEEIDVYDYLVGIRYAIKDDLTVITEYYHNAAGMTEAEYADYADFLETAINSPVLFDKVKLFRRPTLMQDYAYIRIIKDEPFGVVYLSGGMSAIVNLNDGSFTIGPRITYKPFSNTEFSLAISNYNGEPKTEFGDKSIKTNLELGIKLYF